MLNTTQRVLASLLLASAPALSQANNITFDFYGQGPVLDTVSVTPTYNVGSLGLTVSALTPQGSAANVAIRNDGLGVDSGGLLSSGDITDGETLVLTFNQTVKLTGLQFSDWSNGLFGVGADHAVLSWGNQSITLSTSTSHDLWLDSFALADLTGTTFTIKGASGLLNSFRLAGISATPAVPEPASMALMGLGLIGLGFVSLRKKRQA